MRRTALRLSVALVAAAAALAAPGVAAAAIGWCGNDRLSTDRPDALGGRKVHAIYAIPSDGADRFAETASRIAGDLDAVVRWWRTQDGVRAPRLDLFDFPGCGTELGRLDLSFVRLARPAEAYRARATRLRELAVDLQRDFHAPAKKYLVYYDGPVESSDVCGSAFGRDDPDGSGPWAYGAIYLQSQPGLPGCGNPDPGGYRSITVAHELLHMLGAVPAGAPHACAADEAHVCDHELDVMQPSGVSDSIAETILDAGRDDYYGHSGSWLDVQDSLWLARVDLPTPRLTVEVAGAREGTAVASVSPGIACPPACTLPWPHGEVVALEPAAGPRDRFVRWEGACAGEGPCDVAMDADKSVRAVFGPASVLLTIRVQGRGRVASPFFEPCRRRCAESFAPGDAVPLRAVADKGWRFLGWRGCAPARKPACRVVVQGPRTATAVFVRRRR